MLFKPSQSDISLSQHNNHRDGQFIKSVQKIAYLVLLKLPKYSWDPCLGLWISIGDNKWGDGCGARRLHMCTTCSTSQPQHHPQQIFTGRKERESTCGQVVRSKTCPSNQGARRSTWHVPAISPMPGFSAPTQLSNALGVRALITTRGAIALKSHVRNWYGYVIACLIKENTAHNCVQFCVP